MITTWAALADNECVAHAEVADAVANGHLAWATSNPGLASGYCYTRADYEAYIAHADMSASGIASNELMSKSEMAAYASLAAITSSTGESQWITPGVTWQGRMVFGVSANTLSVKVEKSVNGGAYSVVETLNVVAGSSGNVTSWVVMDAGDSLAIRLTPYTGSNGTGTAGPADVDSVFEPA